MTSEASRSESLQLLPGWVLDCPSWGHQGRKHIGRRESPRSTVLPNTIRDSHNSCNNSGGPHSALPATSILSTIAALCHSLSPLNSSSFLNIHFFSLLLYFPIAPTTEMPVLLSQHTCSIHLQPHLNRLTHLYWALTRSGLFSHWCQTVLTVAGTTPYVHLTDGPELGLQTGKESQGKRPWGGEALGVSATSLHQSSSALSVFVWWNPTLTWVRL